MRIVSRAATIFLNYTLSKDLSFAVGYESFFAMLWQITEMKVVIWIQFFSMPVVYFGYYQLLHICLKYIVFFVCIEDWRKIDSEVGCCELLSEHGVCIYLLLSPPP